MTRTVDPDARLLAGRYLLLEHLGSGGMGKVHRAHDQLLDRDVAIKLLHDGPDGDDVRRSRLRAEARFAGAFQHPRLVQVYDFGEDDGTPYVVMQLVDGRPLSEVLAQRGPMPPGEVAHLVGAIADGLAAAHARGTVHRDLKPSNVLVTDDGEPVLIDFGVARSEDAEPLTRTGEIIGTADYLSPEQVRGQHATGASDIYALGVVAYQCLTATSPFRRESRVATALAHLDGDVPRLPDTVPGPMRRLVDQMLAADPQRRPSAAEVARRAVADDGPPTEAIVLDGVHLPRPHLRTPRPVAVAIAAALVLVAAVTVALITGRDPSTPPAAAELALPNVRGEQLAAARRELEKAGFDVAVRRVAAPRAAGLVLAQNPAPGRLHHGDPKTVTLRVASGEVRLDANALVGRPYAEAAAALKRLGLVAGRADETTTAVPAGEVAAVGADGLVPVGARVTLTVAQAPPAQPVDHHVAHHDARPKPPGHAKPKPHGKGKGHHKH